MYNEVVHADISEKGLVEIMELTVFKRLEAYRLCFPLVQYKKQSRTHYKYMQVSVNFLKMFLINVEFENV